MEPIFRGQNYRLFPDFLLQYQGSVIILFTRIEDEIAVHIQAQFNRIYCCAIVLYCHCEPFESLPEVVIRNEFWRFGYGIIVSGTGNTTSEHPEKYAEADTIFHH